MRATASKVGLLKYCKAWAKDGAVWDETSAPDEVDEEDDVSSVDDRDRGDRGHKALADYARTRVRKPVDADIAVEYAAGCDWIDELNVSSKSNLLIETSFAWDPATDTAEIIGVDRDYSKAGDRLPGTADVVLVTIVDGKPIGAVVWDWKFGNSYESPPQLRALGLMVARTFGIDQVSCAALDIGPLGVRELCHETLDAFELSMIAGELTEDFAAIDGSEPTAGAHCSELFCPAKLSCPLIGEGVAQIIPAADLVKKPAYKLTDPITTPEHAAWAVGVISLMNAKLKAIKADIKKLVPDGGWKLEDGRTLEERFSNSYSFSKASAIALLRELGATDEQIEALEVPYQKSQGLRVYGGTAKPRAKRSKAA
jgi:hypothetical protein